MLMLNFLICLIISVSLSYGMAILLVEKGEDFPIKKYRVILQLLLRKVHYKAPQMLSCTTCASFWLALISDIILRVVSGGTYFFWPFSGIIVAGVMWTIIEILNSRDNEQNINNIFGNEEE